MNNFINTQALIWLEEIELTAQKLKIEDVAFENEDASDDIITVHYLGRNFRQYLHIDIYNKMLELVLTKNMDVKQVTLIKVNNV